MPKLRDPDEIVDRIYDRGRAGSPRYYAGFRDYVEDGGRQEPLTAFGERYERPRGSERTGCPPPGEARVPVRPASSGRQSSTLLRSVRRAPYGDDGKGEEKREADCASASRARCTGCGSVFNSDADAVSSSATARFCASLTLTALIASLILALSPVRTFSPGGVAAASLRITARRERAASPSDSTISRATLSSSSLL